MLTEYEPIFGKNVIETLSEGMYDNPLFLFREYVQNAADAIDAAEKEGILENGAGQIVVMIDEDSRTIRFEDNGTGIKKKDVHRMLANIGDSQKDRKSNKGFRGIGRLGGLGYCQKVRFETSAFDENVMTTLEWDAEKLHEILADKNEHMHAGELIKRITTTSQSECRVGEHFFRVSLIDVSPNSDELLDVEEVRKYLAMVAPIPFDYAKFPFVDEIEKFLKRNDLIPPNEYALFINGDEVRKGYETPLKTGDGKSVEILGVECRLIEDEGKVLGWYWFCVSRFEGVLPKKCWQRSIRLRKANIQIGEADCLSNHPRRGISLWKEDRGNNYFLGEIHALDEDLIPNSRRDYFNQDNACRRFESALMRAFDDLDDLYHKASQMRSSNKKIQEANEARKEFETKERTGAFLDKQEREEAKNNVEKLAAEGRAAQKRFEKLNGKATTGALKRVADEYKPEFIELKSEQEDIPFIPEASPKKGFAKDTIPPQQMSVLKVVFEVLNTNLPPDQAKSICDVILRKFLKK